MHKRQKPLTVESAKRVLIVDDDDGIRRSLARIMRCKGFAVETAPDGESALASARTFHPHLLLLDIRMPGIDGVEAFRQIRAENTRVSAIFMTAYSSSTRISEAFELGAFSVLSKPLQIDTLVSNIDQLRKAISN